MRRHARAHVQRSVEFAALGLVVVANSAVSAWPSAEISWPRATYPTSW